MLLAGDFALVEAGEVFFAGGRIEVDFLRGGDCDLALFVGRRHGYSMYMYLDWRRRIGVRRGGLGRYVWSCVVGAAAFSKIVAGIMVTEGLAERPSTILCSDMHSDRMLISFIMLRHYADA